MRNKNIDIIKGFLIFFVMVGHLLSCIFGDLQELRAPVPFFHSTVAFLMPLFFGISGYFFFRSCNKHDIHYVVVSKLKNILYPAAVWSVLYVAPYILYTMLFVRGTDVFSLIFSYNYYDFYWYLTALMLCFAIQLLINRFFQGRKQYVISILIAILLFLAPFDTLTHLEMVWPFFSFGYYAAPIYKKKSISVFGYVALMLVYLVMLKHLSFTIYDEHTTFIYENYMDLYYYLYTLVIGVISGYLVVISIEYLAQKFSWGMIHQYFSECGCYSLELYLMHIVINLYIGKVCDIAFVKNINSLICVHNLDRLVALVLTILYAMILVKIIKMIHKNKYMKYLFKLP